MNLKKDLGSTISMLFLLGLTAVVAFIFYMASTAEIIGENYNSKTALLLEEYK